jgi:hypothetical protein
MCDYSNQNGDNNSEANLRPTGSAGAVSDDAFAFEPPASTGSDGTVSTGAQTVESADGGNLPGDRPISKDDADRLYEENIEDEYAKREGGA